MTTTNEPRNSVLHSYSDHLLLVLILTELRLHTHLLFQREAREEELDGLRAELMNDFDVVDTDATGTSFPASFN